MAILATLVFVFGLEKCRICAKDCSAGVTAFRKYGRHRAESPVPAIMPRTAESQRECNRISNRKFFLGS